MSGEPSAQSRAEALPSFGHAVISARLGTPLTGVLPLPTLRGPGGGRSDI